MDRAHLEVLGGADRAVVDLADRPVTLGRHGGNDVAFPADVTLSARHAVIAPSPDGWAVHDLDSVNGTYVNGMRVLGTHALRPGDQITIGSATIAFRTSASLAVPPPAAPPLAPPPGYLGAGEEWGAGAVPSAVPIVPPAVRPPSGPPPTAPAPPPAAAPAVERRESGPGEVIGIARDIQVRKSQTAEDALVFRIDRYDGGGNRLPSVAVHFRDYRDGHISEGEEVRVSGTWRHGTLRAKRIVNLATNADVRRGGGWQRVVGVIMIVLVLTFIVGIAVSGFLGG